MAITPIPQGVLDRFSATVAFPDAGALQSLTITAAMLGTEGIRLAFDSNATELLPTMTGMVPSPAPYQQCTLTIALVKSEPVANQFIQQLQTLTTLIGAITVYPDVDPSILQPFHLLNMALETIRELSFAGNEATVVVTLRGYILVNQGFFNQ